MTDLLTRRVVAALAIGVAYMRSAQAKKTRGVLRMRRTTQRIRNCESLGQTRTDRKPNRRQLCRTLKFGEMLRYAMRKNKRWKLGEGGGSAGQFPLPVGLGTCLVHLAPDTLTAKSIPTPGSAMSKMWSLEFTEAT
jgi:hypothetical protein